MASYNPGNDKNSCVHGYPMLANHFSRNPALVHMRRFSALSSKSLLRMQYDLTQLEIDMNGLEQKYRDDRKEDGTYLWMGDYAFLKQEKGEEMRRVYDVLEVKLKEYEEALMRYNSLGNRGYSRRSIESIQLFLDEDLTTPFPLSGIDANHWGSVGNAADFMPDLQQLVDQPNSSAVADLLWENILSSASHFPSWVNRIILGVEKASGRQTVSKRRLGMSVNVLLFVLLVLGVWLCRLLLNDVWLIILGIAGALTYIMG